MDKDKRHEKYSESRKYAENRRNVPKHIYANSTIEDMIQKAENVMTTNQLKG